MYLHRGTEFLAFLFLIVYVGAIAVLFLFVIMLIHLKEGPKAPTFLTVGFITLTLPAAIVVAAGVEDVVVSQLFEYFKINDGTRAQTTSSTTETVS